ncbi:formate dehydrogenase family accessory protein FdhD [Actinobacteria bacterium IMCC26256]|nr:formate dehydrogenase family accessory protein FdhD [Actinobacteria bacterium IMCC26256]
MTSRRIVAPALVTVIENGELRETRDRLVIEEPLEIRAHGPGQVGQAVAITMRTPGNDFALAVGFLSSEGLLASSGGLESVAYCTEGSEEQQYNIVTVRTRLDFVPPQRERVFLSSSSCGICGKAALEDVVVSADRLADGPTITAATVLSLPALLRGAQPIFDETGALHAAALFSADGELLVSREDVGRHNAVDKVIGERILDASISLPSILAVSGRVSFEIMQKAAVAGIPVVVAISAPTSLAVEVAREMGQTLIGFVRDERATVYAGAERIVGGL